MASEKQDWSAAAHCLCCGISVEIRVRINPTSPHSESVEKTARKAVDLLVRSAGPHFESVEKLVRGTLKGTCQLCVCVCVCIHSRERQLDETRKD